MMCLQGFTSDTVSFLGWKQILNIIRSIIIFMFSGNFQHTIADNHHIGVSHASVNRCIENVTDWYIIQAG